MLVSKDSGKVRAYRRSMPSQSASEPKQGHSAFDGLRILGRVEVDRS